MQSDKPINSTSTPDDIYNAVKNSDTSLAQLCQIISTPALYQKVKPLFWILAIKHNIGLMQYLRPNDGNDFLQYLLHSNPLLFMDLEMASNQHKNLAQEISQEVNDYNHRASHQ